MSLQYVCLLPVRGIYSFSFWYLTSSRLYSWILPTYLITGSSYDKAYYIAHSRYHIQVTKPHRFKNESCLSRLGFLKGGNAVEQVL